MPQRISTSLSSIDSLKVIFLAGTRSRAAGGVFEVEHNLARRLQGRHHISVDAAGYLDEDSIRDRPAWGNTPVHCFQRVGPHKFGYSPGLRAWTNKANHDILHLHCLWMYTSYIALQWQRRTHCPLVVSPHGMLDGWALRHSGWKKRIAEVLYERRMLRAAAVIHAFHEKDVKDIRAYGLQNPIAVIPNGVDLPVSSSVEADGHHEKRLLFLGRIHPKKGLDELLHAWKILGVAGRDGWRLTIAGWDDGGHLAQLQGGSLFAELQGSVEFVGPAFGEEKDRLLRNSGGFILPSHSEGLPMTVLEAWAYRLPVLMTEHCNLPQGFSAEAAIDIDLAPESMANRLRQFFSLSMESRRKMGENGRKLVENSFTWDGISDQYASVYRWLKRTGDKPDCVRLYS